MRFSVSIGHRVDDEYNGNKARSRFHSHAGSNAGEEYRADAALSQYFVQRGAR